MKQKGLTKKAVRCKCYEYIWPVSFQTLFSWTHEAIRQLSRPDILDSWLATHWLSIVLFLMVAGTVIDFAVWLIRWRPDLVWRGSLSRSASAFRAEERQMRRFRKGFKQNNAEIGAIAQPRQDAPVPEPYQDAPEAEQAAEDEVIIAPLYLTVQTPPDFESIVAFSSLPFFQFISVTSKFPRAQRPFA